GQAGREIVVWGQLPLPVGACAPARRRPITRLHDQRRRYFPAFLRLGGDADALWKLELLALAPPPAMAPSLPRAKVARLVKTHRVRCHDADGLLAGLRAPAPARSEAARAAAKGPVLVLLE